FRTADGLARAVNKIEEMRSALPEASVPAGRQFNSALAEWFELRGSLIAASAVAQAGAARRESRGAHQREDFPDSDPERTHSQRVTMGCDGTLAVEARR
ncbi:MAG: hypothetical protein JO204_07885, partial [Alphaproteobacteria bacterium]|nr:hypothetical protein [Alphaproteobacteria bacterium]